jgi:CRISPR-associated endonuclease/helicase Cas3
MPKIDESTKQQRLDRLYLLLRRHPRGITQSEIAEEVGLELRTTNNYLRELEDRGKIYKDGIYWFPLVLKESQLRPFDLSPEEAVTLYLGARLLAKQQDKRNEPAETALLKLASVLKADAGIGDEIVQAAQELAERPVRDGYTPIFREVVRGYIYRKQIEITYLPLNWQKPFQTMFSSYLLEPSPIGFSTYIIGHSSIVNAVRAYKLERIEAARLTREDYTIPLNFPGLDILRNAWSIVMGEETLRVVLRFNPDVKKRVLETRWHPSQQTDDDPGKPGWLRWQVDVADTLDLLPWVRGWGADVEVLEPESLRKALERETKRLARLYKVIAEDVQNLYFAHTKENADKSEWQRLIDHLNNTARIAAELGQDAGISELARIAGQTHDLGKYSQAFQRRLDGAKQRVDHATAGAQEIWRRYGQTQKWQALMLAYTIAGHHGGLLDYGGLSDLAGDSTLQGRLKKEICDYNAYKSEIDLDSLQLPPLALKRTKTPGFSCSFLTRMLYSTLVDADWLETERAMNDDEKPRGRHESIENLCRGFNESLRRFENPTTAINQKRSETLSACLERADASPGIFTLTIPTGGGKTLASMAFALNHAVKHGLKRIIYVIPFTSIIEQNAAVFKDYLGTENVLEHHSNFDWEQVKKRAATDMQDDETNQATEKLKLAAENWDIPVVVTTNVQFFESLFASKKSRCRKLHNLAKSVIIFDEAQTLPREFMRPCMLAVQELVLNYGASAVFCTATQPLLKQFMPEMPEFTELAPNPQGLFDFYKRVQVKQAGTLTDAELLDKLNDQNQVLCIVNTRKHAKGLFDGLNGEGRFHLSTLMCPAHRKTVLLDVREKLKNGSPCRVISTQVMEAGIDVDFPLGFRALAGLDSVIQAAGRVNREGKMSEAEMFVFEPNTEFIKRTPTFIKQTAEAARSILRQYSANPNSMEATRAYFDLLDTLQDVQKASDAKNILECLNRSDGFDFQTAAEKFKLIDNDTVAVIIPYNDEAQDLVKKLAFIPHPTAILRQLQQYTVSIYENEFQAVNSQGVIMMAADAYAVLKPEAMSEFYSENTGLKIPASAGGEAIFIDN